MTGFKEFLSKLRIKEKKEGILILDIGTQTIKALLLFKNPEGKWAVTETVSENHDIHDLEQAMIKDLEAIKLASKRVVDLLFRKTGFARTFEAVIGIGGSFIGGTTINLRYRREDPEQKITSSEIKNIFRDLHWKAKEKIRSLSPKEKHYQEFEYKIIDIFLQDIKIDGYEVNDPIGLAGKEININVFYTYIPALYEDLLNEISKFLDLEKFEIVQESFSVFHLLKKRSQTLDAILLDIGAKATELTLIRKGRIVGIKHYNLGGSNLTSRIVRELEIGFWEAEDIKLKYFSERLSSFVSEKIKNIFKEDLSLWFSGVTLGFRELSMLNILPPQIFIYGGGSLNPEIYKLFSDKVWYKDLPFTSLPQVFFLDPPQFKEFKNIEEFVLDKLSSSEKNLAEKNITSLSIVPFSLAFVGYEKKNKITLESSFKNIAKLM